MALRTDRGRRSGWAAGRLLVATLTYNELGQFRPERPETSSKMGYGGGDAGEVFPK